MTIFKKSLQNQNITLKDTLIDLYYQRHDKDMGVMSVIGFIAIGAVLGMILLATVRSCDQDTEPVTASVQCNQCHNQQMSLTTYFKDNGSRTPEEMAYAVLQTKSPKLLAAMAVVESDGNHAIRNRGYKKRHDGAFQVNPSIHGKVSSDPVEQALQAERILTELTDKHPIKVALSVYGGDSSEAYQQKVLTELLHVP